MVVLWSACLHSTPIVQVQILPEIYSFICKFVFQNVNKQKVATFPTFCLFYFLPHHPRVPPL